MSGDLEYFRWERSEGGYEWQDAESFVQRQRPDPRTRDSRFLVQRTDQARTRSYAPLSEYATLFKQFAALDPTERSFLRFANEFGPLGISELLARRGTAQAGEPFSRWREQWSRIRAVVHVLDAIQDSNAAKLEQVITLASGGAQLRLEMDDGSGFFEHLATPLTTANAVRPWLWRFASDAPSRTDRLARLASGWVQEAINASIDATRSPEASVTARVLLDEDRFALRVVPHTLLAAMWFQCARMLTVHPTFKQCEQCGKWFELSLAARRRHSKYCSDACKVAKYRAGLAERADKNARTNRPLSNPKEASRHGKTTRER